MHFTSYPSSVLFFLFNLKYTEWQKWFQTIVFILSLNKHQDHDCLKLNDSFSAVFISGFIKSDLRRQKANLKAEVQTVSVSTSVCVTWRYGRDLHILVERECIRCRPGSALYALSSHCCRHRWMQGLHCCTGENFLSKLTKNILCSQMLSAESAIQLCWAALWLALTACLLSFTIKS